jgi:hypothetical protein
MIKMSYKINGKGKRQTFKQQQNIHIQLQQTDKQQLNAKSTDKQQQQQQQLTKLYPEF